MRGMLDLADNFDVTCGFRTIAIIKPGPATGLQEKGVRTITVIVV